MNTMVIINRNDQSRPGGPPRSCAAAIIQAAATTKPGLRNSEGWMEAKPSEYHRVAPLPKSVPKIGSKASAAKAVKNPRMASRRTRVGDISEVISIAKSASVPKKA